MYSFQMNKIHQFCHNPKAGGWIYINSTWKQFVLNEATSFAVFNSWWLFLKRSANWRLLIIHACSLRWRCSLYIGDWKQVFQHWFHKDCYKLLSVVGYEETHVRKETEPLRILTIITSSTQVLSDSNGEGNKEHQGI